MMRIRTARKKASGLPKIREEEAVAGALVQRLGISLATHVEDEKRAEEKISALEQSAAQLSRDLAREMQIGEDSQETLQRLDWEKSQLVAAQKGQDDKLLVAKDDAQSARDVLDRAEAALDEQRQDVARLEARAQAATRRLKDAEARREKLAKSHLDAQAQHTQVAEQLETAAAAQEDKKAAVTRAEKNSDAAKTTVTQAEEAHEIAEQTIGDKRSRVSELTAQWTGFDAEARGLRAALAKNKVSQDAVLDQISVTLGYERALGAVFEDKLSAPVVSDPESSKEKKLWREISGDCGLQTFAESITPLIKFVDAPQALSRAIAAVGVADGAAGFRAQKTLSAGQVLVSTQGDVWRWDGFYAAGDAASTGAALKLEQRNRLAALDGELAALDAQLSDAKDVFAKAAAEQKQAQADEKSARETARQAESALTVKIREMHAAEAQSERLAGRIDFLQNQIQASGEELVQAETELSQARASMVDDRAVSSAREKSEEMRAGVERARLEMLGKRAAAEDMRKEIAARTKRLSEIERERATWSKRLQNNSGQIDDLEKRIGENKSETTEAKARPAELTRTRVMLEADRASAEKRLTQAKENLAAAEGALRKADSARHDAEARLAKSREAMARIEVVLETCTADVAEAEDEIVHNFDMSPEDLSKSFAEEESAPLESLDDVTRRIERLKGQREGLGSVNLRAEEDRDATQKERDELSSDKAEIVAAIAKLRQGISTLNSEGRSRLLAAFDDVNENFRSLFKSLFGGGDANLRLVESDDPLDAGLEIMCQPPGKKLSTLSLLSGGEQTLTATSLIFAVFMVNPSPICVLDEVDAPLDDANVTRFCDLLRDMTERTDTRFLVITHHAVTMSRMDRLYGVTMQERGVSQLVSVDLTQAEKMVDA